MHGFFKVPYDKANANIGPNLEAFGIATFRATSPRFISYAGIAGITTTKAKRHFHGFVNIFDNLFRIEKENSHQNQYFNGVSNFSKLRQWWKTGSREMASVLQDEKRQIYWIGHNSIILQPR